jgi:TfoX/Sxy family transcriptional regulator of competence genes
MAYDHGLADRVRSILNRRAGFSEREMFGGIAFMINGHMCCGVMKTNLMLRLTAEGVASGLRRPHTRPMAFAGKPPMKAMMFVEAEGCDSEEALHEWVKEALAVTVAMPPKKVAVKKTARRSRPRARA